MNFQLIYKPSTACEKAKGFNMFTAVDSSYYLQIVRDLFNIFSNISFSYHKSLIVFITLNIYFIDMFVFFVQTPHIQLLGCVWPTQAVYYGDSNINRIIKWTVRKVE
jgi:hypothetical protein